MKIPFGSFKIHINPPFLVTSPLFENFKPTTGRRRSRSAVGGSSSRPGAVGHPPGLALPDLAGGRGCPGVLWKNGGKTVENMERR